MQVLFSKLLLREDVLETLRHDARLSEPLRKELIALAEQQPEDWNRLNNASWTEASHPGLEPSANRVDLAQQLDVKLAVWSRFRLAHRGIPRRGIVRFVIVPLVTRGYVSSDSNCANFHQGTSPYRNGRSRLQSPLIGPRP